ncbi:MAG TPA: carbamoyltransferase [Chitinophagales bacterium]|nr:carbamoyltransferase [Chitinophagales bacterium]
MTILGISAFYHDSAAAIIQDGKIIAAAQEERFTRIKHDPAFPVNAVKFCLKYAAVNINDLDAIVFYDKPLLKFERLLETYYGFAPKGLVSFIKSMPVWIKEKMFLKRVIHEELEKIEGYDKRKAKFLFPEHHLSHAASAFYSSPYQEAAILTIDGVGEWATASIGVGRGNSIEILKELRFPHSVGLLYSAFTYFLGFKVNSGEYKLMGLAPYGNPDSPKVAEYIKTIKEVLVDIKDDGSIWLNQEYFNYATGLRMVYDNKWEKLFGFKKKEEEDELQQQHCDLGYAIQQVTEEIVLKMATEAKRLTGCDYLTMAGGVALNCVSNGKLLRSGLFKDIFIQPAAGDAGGALGAAQAAYFIHFNQQRTACTTQDEMQGAYLGPQFSDQDIELDIKKYKAVYRRLENLEELYSSVADKINEGNVVGWFQGRMEFGPRALGNRTILGDARNPEMQKKLNLKIKYREGFRPFAPSVMAEDSKAYFELDTASPYMLIVAPVKASRCLSMPANYNSLTLMERLYVLRSDLPAVTHVDFSARVQTIHKETNERYWQLLSTFKQKTGYGIMVNTSFNVRGEPPVCTPEDAYKCFMRTEMDYLVLGNYVLSKAEQPEWKEKEDWRKEFKLD